MKQFILTYILGISIIGVVLHEDPKLEASIERGSEIYSDFCVTCHMGNGEGISFTFPPLANSDYLLQNREESIKGVKYGRQGELIVNGITYNNTFGNDVIVTVIIIGRVSRMVPQAIAVRIHH